MLDQEKKCSELIVEHLRSRIEALETLFRLYQSGDEDGDENLGTFPEFGLSFDYVEAGTFEGQRQGYFRYQISWGGPSDEFRFFCDPQLSAYRVEYWYMDWFDGAKIVLQGEDEKLLLDIFEDFKECGTVEAVFNESVNA